MNELLKIVAIDIATAIFISKAVMNIEDERMLGRIVYSIMAAAWPVLSTITMMGVEIPHLDLARSIWVPGFMLLILTIQIDNKHRLDKLEQNK